MEKEEFFKTWGSKNIYRDDYANSGNNKEINKEFESLYKDGDLDQARNSERDESIHAQVALSQCSVENIETQTGQM